MLNLIHHEKNKYAKENYCVLQQNYMVFVSQSASKKKNELRKKYNFLKPHAVV